MFRISDDTRELIHEILVNEDSIPSKELILQLWSGIPPSYQNRLDEIYEDFVQNLIPQSLQQNLLSHVELYVVGLHELSREILLAERQEILNKRRLSKTWLVRSRFEKTAKLCW